MRRGNWALDVDRLWRASRKGVIQVAALDRLGVPQRTSYRRCLSGGPWRWLLPGIVLLAASPPTTAQRVEAALLHCGDGAMLTGVAAARRHGMRNLPDEDELHLLVRKERRVQSTGFVHVERTSNQPRPEIRDGVPLAPLGRAALDAARRMRATDPIRALLAEVVQRGRCGPVELITELDAGSQRGSALPRQVLGEVLGGARSVAESQALALWRRSKLPPAQWNTPVFDSAGDLVAIPDAWFEEVALAWEIDSVEFHLGPEGYARTLARNTRYAAAGVLVVQTLPSRLRDDPRGVLDELRAAYAAAASRPRPPVHTRPLVPS
ncbi:hypothetical protein [Kutzneria albida]|uniref:DUF559 domain-containing protein n=1 Tax=Kutzneria albida DSM 43870 TaxID=1449976 RepID=W5VZ62_9PSEU|nr:hypothetical protein [Kutzneria albida]AHH94188.1 hypothetical protein KALB_814 [Kutzneria albida DSM 43870]